VAAPDEPPAASLSSEQQPATVVCGQCGATPLLGPYCHDCGQKVEGRLSLPSILQSLSEQVARLDFALLRTLRDVTLHPGRTARAYLSGRRRQYTNPVAYAFLTGTGYALVLGLVPFQSVGAAGQYSALIDAVGPVVPYVLVLALLPVAALQRWVFWRAGLTTAECYVFLLFVWSQLFILGSLLILSGSYDTMAGLVVAGLLTVAFHSWAFLEFYDIGRPSAILASLGAFLLTQVLGLALAMLVRSIFAVLTSRGDGV